MGSQLNPYLQFDGNAREGMEFYRSVLGGELTMNTFGEFGAPDPALADKIMHAQLTTPQGWVLMASDGAPGAPVPAESNVTCSLSGGAGDGIEQIWEKLADGGTVQVPYEKQMWGDYFGQLKDRYGFQWMLNVAAGDS